MKRSAAILLLRSSRAILAALLVGASACSGQSADRDSATLDPALCGAFPAPSGSDAEYTESAVIPVEGEPMLTMGIVALTADSILIFDQDQGRIVLIDAEGRTRNAISRSGKGPGEILPRGAYGRTTSKGKRADWIDADGDVIAVFDGLTVHHFSRTGALLSDVRSLATTSPGVGPAYTSKLRRHESSDYIDIEVLFAGSTTIEDRVARCSYSIYRLDADSARRLIAVDLAAPPVNQRGAVFSGPQEASPRWDIWGGCALITDGGSDYLRFVSLASGEADSVYVQDLPVPTLVESEEIRSLLGLPPGAKLPEPGARARIAQMKVAPDGWIWVQLWQPASQRTEPTPVIRVHPASGAQVRDTVPAFPTAFLSENEFVGVRRTEDGDEELVRVRRQQ